MIYMYTSILMEPIHIKIVQSDTGYGCFGPQHSAKRINCFFNY